MSPAKRAIGSWEILEVLGSGSFAIVWKARHVTTGTPAAVKEILVDRLNVKLKDSLESEIATLQRLNHANIVGLLDLVKEPGRIYLVLEYCGGGDLAHHLRSRGPLSEASCRYLLRQLAEGLKVLRQHQIIHRDLKPQNLLLSDSGPSPTLKIADFGFARSLQPAGMAETLCGSPLYMAPEVLQLHRYDASADLWSVGTILFELLAGKPPFNGANHLQLIQNIERGDAALPDHLAHRLSPGCRQLLSGLLRRNPAERLSFEDFFAHPFLQGEAASAAAMGPAGASAGGTGAGGSAGGSADGSGGSGGSAAASPHQPLQRPRCTPESHGAVRFVQPARQGGPVHPALQVPPSPPASSSSSSSQPPQRPHQHQRQQGPAGGGEAGSAVPCVAAGGGNTSVGSAATATGGTAVGAHAARSPSPRIVAAAAAVASMFMGRVGGGGAGGGAGGSGDVGREPNNAAAGLAGAAGTVGSSGGPLADSLDSEYVVISSPSATPRPAATSSPAQQPLVLRAQHPAMPSSGGPSRSASGGGAPPGPSAQPSPSGAAAATAAAAVCAAATAATAATVAAAPAPSQPTWQQLLPPIAAATLPQGPATGVIGGAAAGGAGPTMTIRLPAPGRDGGDADDPLLLPRVAGLVLDQARARCSAVLDAEDEARQLAAAQQAAAAALGGGGSSFAASGIAGGLGAGEAAAAAALAEEAASAVGTLLAACRLLAAALGPHCRRSGGGSGGQQEQGAVEGPVGTCGTSFPASPPSRAALAALAAQARYALAALDEHISGPLSRLLLAGSEPGVGTLAPPTPTAVRAAAPPPHGHHSQQQQQQPPSAPLVPACCDALLGAAVQAARTAAGEEMLGNAAGAAEQYGRAADVLAFLLAAPQAGASSELQQEEGAEEGSSEKLWDAVRPPLAPHDRQRLTRYFAAVRLRQSTAATAAGPAAAAAAAATAAPYRVHPYSYPHAHVAHAVEPFAAQHDPLRHAPLGGLPYGYAQGPHGAGRMVY